jgi:hypothetical protein
VKTRYPLYPFPFVRSIVLLVLFLFQAGMICYAQSASYGPLSGNSGIKNPSHLTTNSGGNPSQLLVAPGLPAPLNGECATSSSNTTGEKITNVTFNTINNTTNTEAGGYVDYTGSISTTVTKGSTYTLNLTFGNGYANDWVLVWIDYDHSNSFTPTLGTEWLVQNNIGAGPASFSITIPAGATTGNAVMRITYFDGTGGNSFPSNSGCGNYTWGETEDYYLNVKAALPAACAATSTSSAFEYISGVSLVGNAGANISNSPTAGNNYTDYSGSYSATVLTGNTYTVNVTNGSGYATDGCDVWIDWNNDGVFSAGSETVSYLTPTGAGTGGSVGPYAIVFTVPAGATIGDCRMRVAISDKHTSTGYAQISSVGCGTFKYGEVEDYNIHVLTGCNAPTSQATNIVFSSIACNQMNVACTNGNGANRIIVASTSAIGSNPTSGTNYTANAIFGSGNTIGAGQYVVYNSSGSSVTVTGLTVGTTYYFKVFEYNCGNWQYYTGAGAGNPASQATGSTVTAASAGPDQFICASPATLAGNAPAIGSGTWSIINPTGSPAVITTPSSNTSTVTGIPASSYVTLRWTVAGGGCASSFDDVVIRTQ